MERGNSKHVPARDQELARETRDLVGGNPQLAHAEQWRAPEPVDGAIPPPAQPPGRNPLSGERDVELRTEFARIMTRDFFPADRDAILSRLDETDVSQDLAERVARLPADRHFASPHDVLVALGISSPETRGGT
jgi:hypothetical protein